MITSGTATPQALELLSAQHSRLGDVHAAVGSTDGVSATVMPGDTLNLSFTATAVPAGQVRDFFLFTKGVYSSATPLLPEGASSTLPAAFALLQNRPNPFTQTTTIRFDLPVAAHVRLEIFDPQGRLVTRLEDRAFEPGRWSSQWDRGDSRGNPARSGIYLYRMIARGYRAQRKMVLLP